MFPNKKWNHIFFQDEVLGSIRTNFKYFMLIENLSYSFRNITSIDIDLSHEVSVQIQKEEGCKAKLNKISF